MNTVRVKQYEKETNKKVYKTYWSNGYLVSEDYVEWLEEKLSNFLPIHDVIDCEHDYEYINGGQWFKDMNRCRKCGHEHYL